MILLESCFHDVLRSFDKMIHNVIVLKYGVSVCVGSVQAFTRNQEHLLPKYVLGKYCNKMSVFSILSYLVLLHFRAATTNLLSKIQNNNFRGKCVSNAACAFCLEYYWFSVSPKTNNKNCNFSMTQQQF